MPVMGGVARTATSREACMPPEMAVRWTAARATGRLSAGPTGAMRTAVVAARPARSQVPALAGGTQVGAQPHLVSAPAAAAAG